ncbi:MAG: alkaline phosphatase family protein [Candidatus Eisenbacteria bacterium]|nr:alkaline phosphatase family protein [Candidatus Eisenbacteria bacterium]
MRRILQPFVPFLSDRPNRRSTLRSAIRCGRTLLIAGLVALWGATVIASPTTASANGPSKVVVLGFDGADAQLVEQWMNEGKLPHLDRLRKQGTFSPLRPTNPPQTPVSWSTFATGLDPGRTEIFDFLKRDRKTYIPDFAMMTPASEPFLFGPRNPLFLGLMAGFAVFIVALVATRLLARRWVPAWIAALVLGGGAYAWAAPFVRENVPMKKPVAINNRKGTPYWQTLAANGIHSTIVRVPQTFPPDPNPGGRLLSGLGVPDIRGTFGTYTYYTSEPFASSSGDTEKGGKVVLLDVEPGDNSVETIIYGPFNKLFDDPPEILLPVRLELDWNARAVTIQFDDQRISLKEGEWSDFVGIEFKLRKLVKVNGIARFHLLELGPRLRLYMSPIHIDPMRPIVPVTYPPSFAKEIHDRIDTDFPTIGWGPDTWALDEQVTTEEVFAEDVDFTTTKFEKIFDAFLTDERDRVFTQIFYFTDRVAHMFWRFQDPGNPAFDQKLAPEWSGYLLQSYQRMDAIVGRALDKLPPDGILLVCSGHGCSTWRRSFNMNTWLVRNGFMSLKGQNDAKPMTLDDLFVEGQFWPNVDWSRTRVYALGLGAMYVNLLGREKEGIVSPGEEYDQTIRELKEKLEAFVDTTTGIAPIHRVYTRDEMYKDYDPELMPDLRAANSYGYRVSWQTSLGGIPKELFEEHNSKWSGDHCSLDPSLVPGILFSSRPLALESVPGIEDMTPTLLDLFGLAVPAEMAGRPLRRQ